MPFAAPPMPSFTEGDPAHVAHAYLRYEDVAQDGRVHPLALPPAMSELWRAAIRGNPGHRASMSTGVIPILTRLTLTALDAPIRVDQPAEARAGAALAHARDPDGGVRIFMNVWAELRGAGGKVSASRPPGPPALAGHVFAEHTFTRPFAPPAQRRVTRLAAEGLPEVPDAVYAAPPPATAGDAPPGARWLDELAADPAEAAFTLDQTDSNQHVNSLVYVRVFLDAANRRYAAAGLPLSVLSREVDIAYRKPCFAGDRVRAHLRLFEAADGVGCAGFLAAPGEEARPRCYIRVLARA